MFLFSQTLIYWYILRLILPLVSLSLEDDIWLPDGLIFHLAEHVQIGIRVEVEEYEPEVIPLNLEGERDSDLADLVVNVVDVENFPQEGDGCRASWCRRQHFWVVVGGQDFQYLAVGLKVFDQREKRWVESGSIPWVSLLAILAEIVKQNSAGPILWEA